MATERQALAGGSGERIEPTNPDTAITQYYQTYLGRTPSQAEINSWIDTGKSLEAILTSILHSPESVNRHNNRGATTTTTSNPTGDGGPTAPVDETDDIDPTPTDDGTPGTTTPDVPQVVPGTPNASGQINVVDYSGQQALNPQLPGGSSMIEANKNNQYGSGAQVNGNDPKFNKPNFTNLAAAQANFTSAGDASTVSQVAPKSAATVDPRLTFDDVAAQDMTAAQGAIRDQNLVDAPQADMEGLFSGANSDGTTNWTGKALNEFVTQNMSNVIDTSTAAGKALAEQLGQFNYLDSKATLKGQLDILQAEFTGPNGEPKIPAWAAATARSVGRIAAFNGATGTAATAAMAQALMEASLPVAQADAQFFQTLTLQNLTNKQAQVLNKANVLAKFDLTNLDNRMTAAVENAKAFLQMDLANLANEQQARIINTQNRVQSILEDAKATNTARMFNAEQQNSMAMFYDNLNSSIAMHNSAQVNAMKQFNAAQANEVSMFNANQLNQVGMFNKEMNMRADEFYKTMQYNIDVANANWRQEITLQDNLFKFNAAATDIKMKFDISQESLNRIWDRSDALLDYLWKSSENQANRDHELAVVKLRGDMQAELEDNKGWGQIWGTIIGDASAGLFDGLWDSIF